MASALDDQIEIADNNNNVAGLTALADIDPPLFEAYAGRGTVLTEWRDSEEVERDANKNVVLLGNPYVQLRLFGVSIEERLLLKGYEGPVTVHLYNKSTAAWGDYNGILEMPISDSRWSDGSNYWQEVQITIRDLEEIV